jgi:hypothetical protein
MAAGAVTIPAGNLEKFFDGTIDLDTDDLKVALFNSSFSTATTAYSTTNELATANGYTQGGATLANVTLAEAAGTVTLDADDTTWTAASGDIVARYAVIYDDTDVGKTIIGYVLLDTTPADVTVTDGNDFTIVWAATGILTATQA